MIQPTDEQQRAWMAQWRSAAVALGLVEQQRILRRWRRE
jgi:hypothetical protein